MSITSSIEESFDSSHLSSIKRRTWCFTLNESTPEDIALLKDLVGDGPGCTNGATVKYVAFVEQTCLLSSTNLLRGYLQFYTQVHYIPTSARLRGASLTPATLSPYEHRMALEDLCISDSSVSMTFNEFGQVPKPPHESRPRVSRSKESRPRKYRRLERASLNDRMKNESIQQLLSDGLIQMSDVSWLESSRRALQLESLRSNCRPAIEGDLPHVWYWGPSLSVLSTKVLKDTDACYLKPLNSSWDGYNNESVVLVQGFALQHSNMRHQLNSWGDRYPFPAELEGTCIPIRPLKIVVTSNYPPSDIWSDSCLDSVLRRFSIVYVNA